MKDRTGLYCTVYSTSSLSPLSDIAVGAYASEKAVILRCVFFLFLSKKWTSVPLQSEVVELINE